MASQWCKLSRTHDLQKTKSVVVNKTGKVEVHITDNQSWNNCHKVASGREFTFSSAIEPTKKKHNVLWPCPYTWPLTSAKTGCLCGLDTLVNTSVLCAELRLEFCWETVAGLSVAPLKQLDTRPPELYFNRIKVLRGVGIIGLLGF